MLSAAIYTAGWLPVLFGLRGFGKAKPASAARRRSDLLFADAWYSTEVLRFSTILIKKHCLKKAVNI